MVVNKVTGFSAVTLDGDNGGVQTASLFDTETIDVATS